VWQRTWEDHAGGFRMLAVAQDAQGEERVRPVVAEREATFPVLVDRESVLARKLGFRIVPTGFFVGPDGVVRYRHPNDFDIADPRVRWNLDRFLAGEETEAPAEDERMSPEALELFAAGVALYSRGSVAEALGTWREALALDADNFVIRSQIWAVEHPERFYPVVDREWQEFQLVKEGYDKPLP
jgi:hypothetical protein